MFEEGSDARLQSTRRLDVIQGRECNQGSFADPFYARTLRLIRFILGFRILEERIINFHAKCDCENSGFLRLLTTFRQYSAVRH